MKRKIRDIIFVVVIIAVAAWVLNKTPYPYSYGVLVEDVTKPEKIVLNHEESCLSLSLRVKGYIDGMAKLHIFNGDKKIDSLTLKGKTIVPYWAEWSGRECILKYEPIEVKDGKVFIEYAFNIVDQRNKYNFLRVSPKFDQF